MYQALFQYFNINSDTVIIPIFTNEETKLKRKEVTYLFHSGAT